MLHVIASIHVKDGCKSDLLKIYKTFVPKVMKEAGCLMYMPTVDFDVGVHTQQKNENIVTVIEQWINAEAFKRHLVEAHSVQFREDIKDIVENVSIKALENTL